MAIVFLSYFRVRSIYEAERVSKFGERLSDVLQFFIKGGGMAYSIGSQKSAVNDGSLHSPWVIGKIVQIHP